MNGKVSVWHYLHGQCHGRADAVREEDLLVFSLPNPKDASSPLAEYRLQIDPRDRRTLVVFDGHIPCNGLPGRAEVVFSFPLPDLKIPVGNLKRSKLDEENPVWHIFDDGKNQATLRIKRYFVLLPNGSFACVKRYDEKTFRTIYAFIEINDKHLTEMHMPGAILRTSSS